MSLKKTNEELIAESNAAIAIEIEARKEAEVKAGFLNPYGEGTSYKEFLAAVKTSKVSVKEYCKDKLTDEEIEFLLHELSILK